MASGWKVLCAKCACDSDTLKRCMGCFQVYYCSTTCQKAHWPVHKSDCKAEKAGRKSSSQQTKTSTTPIKTDSEAATSSAFSESGVQHLRGNRDDSKTQRGDATLTMCSFCKKAFPITELKQCGACRKVSYCSKSCQKNHWKQHKPDCAKVEETIKTDGAKRAERETFLRRGGASAIGPAPIDMSPLDIMISRMANFPESTRSKESFEKAILKARRSFPGTRIVDRFSEVPHEHVFFFEFRSDWVVVAYISKQHGHVLRHGIYIKDKVDAETFVLFYLERDSPFPYFKWSEVRPGRYICIRRACMHGFMDGTVGIRVDYPDCISFIDA